MCSAENFDKYLLRNIVAGCPFLFINICSIEAPEEQGFFMKISTYLIVHEAAEALRSRGLSHNHFDWTTYWVLGQTTYHLNRIHFLENGDPEMVAQQIKMLASASCAIGANPILLVHEAICQDPLWISALQGIRTPYLGLKCFSDAQLYDLIRELSEPDMHIRRQWSHLKCSQGNIIPQVYPHRYVLLAYLRALTSFASAHRDILSTAKRAFYADEFFCFRTGGVMRYALKSLPVCGFEMRDEVPIPFGFLGPCDRVRLEGNESGLTENGVFWRVWLQMVRTRDISDFS